jgi:hypothetical protein
MQDIGYIDVGDVGSTMIHRYNGYYLKIRLIIDHAINSYKHLFKCLNVQIYDWVYN